MKREVIYMAEGRTGDYRLHALETPNRAEALEHVLQCWLVFGCSEIKLKREFREIREPSEGTEQLDAKATAGNEGLPGEPQGAPGP